MAHNLLCIPTPARSFSLLGRVFMEERDSLLHDDHGLSTVEYVIILILIAIVAITAWQNFGQSVENKSRQATGSINGLP